MSTRIEASISRTQLLGALPPGWAQAIVTSPTRADLRNDAERVFAELQRVLRDDGTLWVLCAGRELPDALERSGWLPREVDWGTPLMVDPAGRARLHLLAKQPDFHYSARTAQLFMARRTRAAFARQRRRERSCPWSPEHRDELTRLCILAGSSRIACGTCQTAYQRTQPGDPRPACRHEDPSGRGLILDPFHHPGAHAAQIATRLGRTFIGLTGDNR